MIIALTKCEQNKHLLIQDNGTNWQIVSFVKKIPQHPSFEETLICCWIGTHLYWSCSKKIIMANHLTTKQKTHLLVKSKSIGGKLARIMSNYVQFILCCYYVPFCWYSVVFCISTNMEADGYWNMSEWINTICPITSNVLLFLQSINQYVQKSVKFCHLCSNNTL